RLLAQQASDIVGVGGPVAGSDPARSVESKTTKPCGFDSCGGADKRLVTPSLEVLGESRHSRSIRLAIRDRPHNALEMTVVACFAATTARVPAVTMISTLSRANSAAISVKRSSLPSPHRYSIV